MCFPIERIFVFCLNIDKIRGIPGFVGKHIYIDRFKHIYIDRFPGCPEISDMFGNILEILEIWGNCGLSRETHLRRCVGRMSKVAKLVVAKYMHVDMCPD